MNGRDLSGISCTAVGLKAGKVGVSLGCDGSDPAPMTGSKSVGPISTLSFLVPVLNSQMNDPKRKVDAGMATTCLFVMNRPILPGEMEVNVPLTMWTSLASCTWKSAVMVCLLCLETRIADLWPATLPGVMSRWGCLQVGLQQSI